MDGRDQLMMGLWFERATRGITGRNGSTPSEVAVPPRRYCQGTATPAMHGWIYNWKDGSIFEWKDGRMDLYLNGWMVNASVSIH